MAVQWRSVGSAFAAAALAALLAYGLARADLFGVKTAADRTADHIQQRFGASTYGESSKDSSKTRSGQRAISVLTVDDDGLDRLRGVGWQSFPPSYDLQAILLDDLSNSGRQRPAAIFLDIAYRGKPGEHLNTQFIQFQEAIERATGKIPAGCGQHERPFPQHDLFRMACIVINGGIPVVLARQPRRDGDPPLTDVQKALAANAVLVSIEGDVQQYPLVKSTADTQPEILTPALALYAIRCFQALAAKQMHCHDERLKAVFDRADIMVRTGRSAPVTSSEAQALTPFGKSLDIIWGGEPAPGQQDLIKAVSGQKKPCAERAKRVSGPKWLWNQIMGERGPGEGAFAECLYHLNLGYDRLVDSTGLTESDLDMLLGGRLVLFGGRFRAGNDWAPSPVHGQVAGVYLHAMALDNLIQGEGRYRHGPEDQGLWDSNIIEALLLFLLAFLDGLALMYRQSVLDRFTAQGVGRLPARAYLPIYGGVFGLSAVIFLIIWKVDDLVAEHALVNMFGLIGVALAFLAFSVRDVLPRDLAGSLSGSRGGTRLVGVVTRFAHVFEIKGKRLFAPPPPAPKPAARRKKSKPKGAS